MKLQALLSHCCFTQTFFSLVKFWYLTFTNNATTSDPVVRKVPCINARETVQQLVIKKMIYIICGNYNTFRTTSTLQFTLSRNLRWCCPLPLTLMVSLRMEASLVRCSFSVAMASSCVLISTLGCLCWCLEMRSSSSSCRTSMACFWGSDKEQYRVRLAVFAKRVEDMCNLWRTDSRVIWAVSDESTIEWNQNPDLFTVHTSIVVNQ